MKLDFSILVYFLVLLFLCAPVFQCYEYNEESTDDDIIQQKVQFWILFILAFNWFNWIQNQIESHIGQKNHKSLST
jgi:hypothetical protein